MIALMLAQVAARWGQALTLLVLSAVATGAAVSAPVFAESVDRAAVAEEVAAADGRDLMVSIPATIHEWTETPEPWVAHADAMSALGSFDHVFTVEIRVRGLRENSPPREIHRMLGRDGFCRHVVFRAGRCPAGNREIALPLHLAESVERWVGDQVTLVPVVETDRIADDGPPTDLTVVGIFEARDPTDPYWGAALNPLGTAASPPAIFASRAGLQTMPHTQERFHADAILPGQELTLEQIPRIREQIGEAGSRLAATQLAPHLVTELPALLTRIEDHSLQVRRLLPITAFPLAGLCWLVLFLAVGHGVAARRQEVGAVAVRGVPARTRAAMVSLECLVPVLLGVPLGIVLAHLLGGLAGPAPGQFGLSLDQFLAAGLALAGSLVAVLLAMRRELATPVARLLRRVPPRRRAVTAAGEVLVVGIAVVVVADLRFFDRDLQGLMTLAPALVMVAAAVLATRLVRPCVDLIGGWSLRRGRLAPALAARHLARRPGAMRLLVVLGLVFGMLGFGVASAEVAAAGRVTDAERTLGAVRVVNVAPVDAGTLLAAVRGADPSGQYAMAAIRIPRSQSEPPRLAVDSSRLARIARWPEGSVPATTVAARLRPDAAPPALVHNGELVAEMVPDRGVPDGVLTVAVRLAPVAGGEPVTASFDPLVRDRDTYHAEVSGCAQGCRVAGLALLTDLDQPRDVGTILRGLRQDGADVFGGDLADLARWRSPDGLRATSPEVHLRTTSGGLSLVVNSVSGESEAVIMRVDAPYPLPVVTAGDALAGDTIRSLDHETLAVTTAAAVPALPALGGTGVLMDLEHAEHSTTRTGTVHPGQVWLSGDAPAGIVDRLREQGLQITGERAVADLVAAAERTGAAYALRFFLLAGAVATAVGALALVLVVAVDRRGGSQSARELRQQGVARRTVVLAAWWSYGGVVLVAALTGAFGAAVAWLATGDRLPLGLDRPVVPAWPDWTAVVAPWTVVVAVLLVAAALGAVGRRPGVRTEVRG